MITVTLDEGAIDDIFRRSETQTEYIEALYEYVLSLADIEWDDVACANIGSVTVGPRLNHFLFTQSIQWDRDHKVNTMIGGAWMNWGFSSSEDIADPLVALVDPEKMTYNTVAQ